MSWRTWKDFSLELASMLIIWYKVAKVYRLLGRPQDELNKHSSYLCSNNFSIDLGSSRFF
jgi:hypothetical protein